MLEEVAEKIASGEYLAAERQGRNKVWKLYKRVCDKEGNELGFVCCKFCGKIATLRMGQLSNLLRHICRSNIDKYENASSDASFVSDEKEQIKVEADSNNLTRLLANWIVKNCVSLDLIQSQGLKAVFQELLNLGAKFGADLKIRKILPSSIEMSENINYAHNRLFESIDAEIGSVKHHGFAVTTYTWTDDVMKESYIILTIHYLKNCALTNYLLGLRTIEGKSITSENVAESVKNILEEFDCELSSKCFCVTDSNFINTLPEEQNLPCISNLLNNALLRSVEKLPKVSQIINACFKLVNSLRKNTSNNLSGQLSIKSHHNRILTIYNRLKSIVRNWNEIVLTLQNMNETPCSSLSKYHLEALLNTLQPFIEAIETLEDDSNATLHLVMAYMHELKKVCQATDEEYEHLEFVKNFQEIMLLELEDIVTQKITILHKIAVFLYPPTNKLLPYSDEEKKSIEDKCMDLMKNYKHEAKPFVKQEPEEEDPLAFMCKRRKLFSDFLESQTNDDPNELIKQEMQNYKNTRVAFSSDFNAFDWWELQQTNFPLLYRLSCAVLVTPATSAASRRVFFNAKRLITEKHTQTSTEIDTEKIVFISTNGRNSTSIF